jgi:hypothetical protein
MEIVATLENTCTLGMSKQTKDMNSSIIVSIMAWSKKLNIYQAFGSINIYMRLNSSISQSSYFVGSFAKEYVEFCNGFFTFEKMINQN